MKQTCEIGRKHLPEVIATVAWFSIPGTVGGGGMLEDGTLSPGEDRRFSYRVMRF